MLKVSECLQGIKNKSKAISNKVSSFATAKKAQAITNIETNSASVFLLKWAMTNWVTVILVTVIAILGVRSYLIKEELRASQLNEELHSLNIDLEKMKKERAQFLARIKELEAIKKTNLKENKKVREDVSKLSSEEKKRILLEYKNRLLKKRGI